MQQGYKTLSAPIFQPAPPVGAETGVRGDAGPGDYISTRSARGGGDHIRPVELHQRPISTHSARGGGDEHIIR